MPPHENINTRPCYQLIWSNCQLLIELIHKKNGEPKHAKKHTCEKIVFKLSSWHTSTQIIGVYVLFTWPLYWSSLTLTTTNKLISAKTKKTNNKIHEYTWLWRRFYQLYQMGRFSFHTFSQRIRYHIMDVMYRTFQWNLRQIYCCWEKKRSTTIPNDRNKRNERGPKGYNICDIYHTQFSVDVSLAIWREESKKTAVKQHQINSNIYLQTTIRIMGSKSVSFVIFYHMISHVYLNSIFVIVKRVWIDNVI